MRIKGSEITESFLCAKRKNKGLRRTGNIWYNDPKLHSHFTISSFKNYDERYGIMAANAVIIQNHIAVRIFCFVNFGKNAHG